MIKITRSKEFTINMGNYESYKSGASVELQVPEGMGTDDETYASLFAKADAIIESSLKEDLEKAADISGVANTYILTWLEDENA